MKSPFRNPSRSDPAEVFLSDLYESETNPQNLCGEYDDKFVAIFVKGGRFAFYVEDNQVKIRSEKPIPICPVENPLFFSFVAPYLCYEHFKQIP